MQLTDWKIKSESALGTNLAQSMVARLQYIGERLNRTMTHLHLCCLLLLLICGDVALQLKKEMKKSSENEKERQRNK